MIQKPSAFEAVCPISVAARQERKQKEAVAAGLVYYFLIKFAQLGAKTKARCLVTLVAEEFGTQCLVPICTLFIFIYFIYIVVVYPVYFCVCFMRFVFVFCCILGCYDNLI